MYKSRAQIQHTTKEPTFKGYPFLFWYLIWVFQPLLYSNQALQQLIIISKAKSQMWRSHLHSLNPPSYNEYIYIIAWQVHLICWVSQTVELKSKLHIIVPLKPHTITVVTYVPTQPNTLAISQLNAHGSH